MKLLLFLGSGVSYLSGLPSVDELTQSLLNDQWIQHTDGCFYPAGVGPRGLNDPAHILQDFLALLMPHADRSHAMTGRKANYEDLYFLAEQVAEDVRGWADNPAIHPFVSELKRQTTQLTNTLHESLGKVANMACEFIRCVVYNRLAKTGDVRGLNLIESLARADSIEKLAIVTVNHDLLIERLLEEKGVGFVDGFGEPVGDVRYFEPSAFGLQTKVRLLKLHGSINWYRFRGQRENPFSDRYGIPVHGDVWHCKDGNGHNLDNIDAIPWILTGTNNKAAQYGFGIYGEIHFWFHKLLQEHDTIALSGYGWSDRGINGRLMHWLHAPAKRHLFLMHQRPDELASYSKSSLWHRYDPLVRANRIIPIAKWMQDVSLDELLNRINNATGRPGLDLAGKATEL